MSLFRVPFIAGLSAFLFMACPFGPQPRPPPNPLPQDTDLGVSGAPQWPPGTVELGLDPQGTGFKPFGNTFDFEHGPQGGIHIPGAWRVHQKEFVDARFVVRVRRISDGLLLNQNDMTTSSNNGEIEVIDAGVDAGTVSLLYSGQFRIYLCPVKDINLVGVPVSFELTVIGSDKIFLGRTSSTTSTQEIDCKP
jgi:hypothetical protein